MSNPDVVHVGTVLITPGDGSGPHTYPMNVIRAYGLTCPLVTTNGSAETLAEFLVAKRDDIASVRKEDPTLALYNFEYKISGKVLTDTMALSAEELTRALMALYEKSF